jgi:PAS domain S-box-containing protein
MEKRENELEKLEKLAELFSTMGDFTQVMRDSYSRLESRYEDVNSRLARVNELLRKSLGERNTLANYLSNILESLDSGVIVTDCSGVIDVFNAAAERYTGVKAQDAVGRVYYDVIDVGREIVAEAAGLAGGASISGELTIHAVDRSSIPAAFSVTRLRQSGAEERTGLVIILYDLSEVKGLEDNLKRVTTLAALGEMAATVAHEIRNPLAGISGFAALLLRDLDEGSESRRLAEKISSGVKSLNSIVESLLDYTKDICPEKSEVDPLRVVEEAISELDSNSENRVIEVSAGSRNLKAVLDPHLFRMVVFNLLTNAIQACPAGGRVKVSMKNGPRGELQLTVEDEGPGIELEALDKLFVPFYTTKANGTGLGLATVKKLTELHGGRVSAANAPGGGAVFTVEIPCDAEEM